METLTAADVNRILDAVADDAPILVAFRLISECGAKVGQVVTLRSLHVKCYGGRFWLDVGRGELLHCPDDLAFELLALESSPELPLVRYDATTLWRRLQAAVKVAGIGKRVTTEALRWSARGEAVV